jgi:hypothetical protein
MTTMLCPHRAKDWRFRISIFVRPSEPLPPHPDSNKTFGALPIVLEGYDPTVLTRYIFVPNTVCLTLIKGSLPLKARKSGNYLREQYGIVW